MMSFLLNSKLPKIRKGLGLFPAAEEVWEAVNHNYLKIGVAAHIYKLKTQIHKTKRGTMTVTKHYNTMRSLWMELDIY